MTDAAEKQAVTFVRDGFQTRDQIHIAGTWTLMDSNLADLSAEEQEAELGAVYFQPGIADGAVPAEAVGSGQGSDRLISVDEAAAILNRTGWSVRHMIARGTLPVAQRAGGGSRAPYLLSLRTVFGLHRNPERLALLLGEASATRSIIESTYSGESRNRRADGTSERGISHVDGRDEGAVVSLPGIADGAEAGK
ncbi:MAG: hypothetical protein AB7I08_12285 [Thermoleophilia bacterium]